MEKEEKNGMIIQSISGFYYVEAADSVIYECKAKGSFRKEKRSPVTGDRVLFEADGDKGFITKIGERKNLFVRPPVANIDRLFIVASVDRPKPNLFVVDKLTAFCRYRGVEPVVVFSKADLGDADAFVQIYQKAGIDAFACSAATGAGLSPFAERINGRLCAFTGNSGVGKSSILNALIPALSLPTNEISDKLGRGRHTTRCVTIYAFAGGYVADTPGFSSFEFENGKEKIEKGALAACFPEFAPFAERCRFYPSCAHRNDRGCAVAAAAFDGDIPETRYKSYCRMHDEVKDLPAWKK